MNALLAGVDNREKGAFPVSIGTSLAIESACGVYPDRPVEPAPLTNVREIWFNIRTLLRNLIGSLPNEVKDMVVPSVLVPAMLEELGVIEAAISKASNGMVRVVYYCCEYATLPRDFPRANLRIPKTDKQIQQRTIEEQTIKELFKSDLPHDVRIYRYALKAATVFPHAFIVTHLPVDLLSRYSFKKLELLESHTGAIKSYPNWYSKLTGGKDLSNIPFNRFSLQVFGDNGHQFAPFALAVRREVLQMAEQDLWTAVSTEEKIRASLRKMKDQVNKTVLLSLL